MHLEGARRFEGRRVIVTGGARGIGRGIVDAFLDEGAEVLATDILGEDLEAVRASHPHADRLSVHVADLADVEQVRTVVPAAIEALGSVDILVNNAGVQPDGAILDVTPEAIDACFAVNVRAPMLLMQGVCRHLIERTTPGSIVNIASANAFQNESPESIYNASKAPWSPSRRRSHTRWVTTASGPTASRPARRSPPRPKWR